MCDMHDTDVFGCMLVFLSQRLQNVVVISLASLQKLNEEYLHVIIKTNHSNFVKFWPWEFLKQCLAKNFSISTVLIKLQHAGFYFDQTAVLFN